VATQTVEVGANLDFDALVTEAAPLDALRQRFGRLDRLGKRHERNVSSPACILIAHLDAWVQTNPVPVPDPDVAPFLHGQSDAPADVQVVWRADLNREDERLWAKIVSLMPPRTREALPVPVYEVRAWLKAQAEANIADIEGVVIEATMNEREQPRRALR